MITKQYIIESDIPLSVNIKHDKVAPYISKSLRSLKAILSSSTSTALYAALVADAKIIRPDWSITQKYAANDQVLHVDSDGQLRAWKSLTTNTGSEPSSANTTNWDEVELGTFLCGYVQPYLAHKTYYQYCILGGVNSSHQGLQVVSNETAVRLDGNALKEYLHHWDTETGLARTAMIKHLDDMNHTLDGTTYQSVEPNRKRKRTIIRSPYVKVGTSRTNRDMYP